MTKEQLEKANRLIRHLSFVEEKNEIFTRKGRRFNIVIVVGDSDKPSDDECVDITGFLSPDDIEDVRLLIQSRISRDIEDTKKEFAEL